MTHERSFGPVRITLVRGDIADQPDVDAIVNAANPQLRPGSGVAGAIHRRAGPGLAREAVPLGPIDTGAAVITGGHDLPNAHVVHVVGPVHGVDTPSDELLATAVRNALRLADRHELRSLALPAISTGAYGYPLDEAARVTLRAASEAAPGLEHLREVRFVLFSDDDLAAFARALDDLS